MSIKTRRIGVILVHGIGDQRRFEHVDNVAKHFVDIACHQYGAENVSVSAHPGYRGTSPVTLHISTHPGGQPDVQLDFHEVWWRDLGDEQTFGRIIRFWRWALSIAGTRGQFSTPTTEFDLPKNQSSSLKRVGFTTRLQLFFTTTFFFVMLAPMWLLTNFANIIPGLPKIRLFSAIFAYMSSVKLYQDFSDDLAGTLEDFDQPRRFSIQRKVHEKIIHVAKQNYDQWYLAGHSLGSVIAFKALFSGQHGFARLLNKNIWDTDVPPNAKLHTPPPEPYPDEPRCPNWLSPDSCIDTQLVFARCAGFISWGSPLETFAHTWPATLPTSRSIALRDNFEWVNIYDAADVVASQLTSFTDLQAKNGKLISPINVSTRSNWFIGHSHTHYLHTSHRSQAESKVGFTLLQWMLGQSNSFMTCAKSTGLQITSRHEERVRRLIIGAQCLVALGLGLLLWPKATVLLVNILQKIPEIFIGFLNQEWAAAYASATNFLFQELNDPKLSLNLLLDMKIIAHTAATLFVFAGLQYLFGRKGNVPLRAPIADQEDVNGHSANPPQSNPGPEEI